jgi:hypothetical protein
VASTVVPVGHSATAAQWRTGSTLQHTRDARTGGRSCIGELTLHRVRVGPRRRTNEKLAPARRPSQHYRSGSREGARWRGRAVRVAQARSSG